MRILSTFLIICFNDYLVQRHYVPHSFNWFVEALYLEPFPDYQVFLSSMAFMTFHRYPINYLLPVLFQYFIVMLRPNEEWRAFFCERLDRIDESD